MLATRFPSFALLRFFKVSLTKSVVFARYSLRGINGLFSPSLFMRKICNKTNKHSA